MPLPSASVVVPARDAASTIERCVQALMEQSYPAELREVIVVDDGSRDGTAELAARLGARLVRETGRGPAAARNAGARAATGEILVFTDADCEPDVEWLTRLLAPFGDAAVAASKGTYRTRQRELVALFAQAEYEEKYARMARFPTIDFVDTYAAAYRRDLFLESGGFDERYRQAANEDLDLSFRLAEQGRRMIFVPAAVVWHKHPQSVAAYARRKFKVGYWKPLLHRDHPQKARSDSHTPASLRWQVRLAAIAAAALPWSAFNRIARWVLVAALTAHLTSSVSLARLGARYDPRLLVAAPLLALVRSYALGGGYLVGWWSLRRSRT